MPRFARVVMADLVYHVTHRGNRRGDIFFQDSDRRDYLDDLGRCAREESLEIWAYCLMTNHVHLIVRPRRADSLARAIGRAHQLHTIRINRAHAWRGHLWANRFYSTPLDETHRWVAAKYIELNPVRAGLARRAERWPWSSAGAHAGLRADSLLSADRPFGADRPHPITGCPLSWADWLAMDSDDESIARLRHATSTGRPCGSPAFVASLETLLNRTLAPLPPGPKPGRSSNVEPQLEMFDE